MSTTRPSPDLARRNFLKGATLAGAATLASPTGVQAQLAHPNPRVTAMVRPDLVAETMPPSNDPVTQTSSGGDFMVDVLKTLNIDYCAINPASSFRGIQEAIINYGQNTKPELITCPHEEIAVSMAQGYAKMDGRPMAVLAHGTVGLQHAAMGLYNAFCDRVPVYLMIGNIVDAEKRMPGVEGAHSAIDPAALVRDFVKWDDQPASLQHFAESAVRAYKIATTPPMAPVLLSLDAELQENPITDPESLHIPKLAQVALPQGDPSAVDEAARLLVRAQNPVILCDRVVRTPAGLDRIIELAETLQCAVIDLGGRMNFPSRHPLNQSFRRPAVIGQADLIFGIELNDYYGAVHGFSDRIIRHTSPMFRPNVRTISLGVRDLYTKSNYQEFQRYADADLAIAGDGEATLPALIEAVKRRVDAGRAGGDGRGCQERSHHRLGCKSDHHRAAVCGAMGADPSRRLVAGWQRHPYAVATAVVGFRCIISLERILWRRRRRLQRSGFGGRGARQQEAWTAEREHPGRRRHDVRTRHLVDGRAPSHSHSLHHAQQSGLSSGIHVRAGDGQSARSWHQ
jgi:acetolactate synthase-1/2/3 large subunit